MMKLSLIIPMYNASLTIVDTLNSIFKNFIKGVEVIVVDDGSTDDSNNKVISLFSSQALSGQLKLIHQENKGVSEARNNGINSARGQYIGFVDADDLVLEGYCSELLTIIDSENPDIIEFGYKEFCNKADGFTSTDTFIHKNFGLNISKEIQDEIFLKSTWYPWARVFKAQFFKENKFPVGVRFCEDMMCLYKIYEESESVFLINKALYGYRINSDGATQNIKEDYIGNMISFYEKILKDNSKHMRYLKIQILYVIYRCSLELNVGYNVPLNILIDSKVLFVKTLFDINVSIRKKRILALPSLHIKIMNLKKSVKGKS